MGVLSNWETLKTARRFILAFAFPVGLDRHMAPAGSGIHNGSRMTSILISSPGASWKVWQGGFRN
jgi:hypothetical protein